MCFHCFDTYIKAMNIFHYRDVYFNKIQTSNNVDKKIDEDKALTKEEKEDLKKNK